ncbi:hypothetical protein QR680_005659 [Steinernema hermaphroditum]|uniref:Glycosyltransferase family 92 protein n=1 Tax=Steinernema hermaphroditum TaxID=289476 RepID=A0AA39LVT1_9BILA|nr:hypothetical protein QR680_005659 [Steinernema hermaphroditum]
MPPQRRIFGVLFAALLGGILLYLSLASSQLPRNRFLEQRLLEANPLEDDSLIVYRGYLDRRNKSRTLARILVFGRCPSVRFRLYVGSMQAEVVPIEGQCPWKWAPRCEWNSFLLTADISHSPSHKEVEATPFPPLRPLLVLLSLSGRSLRIPLLPYPEERSSGLSVCVPPLYWFSNWPALVHFVELWRLQGASHFFVYVHSISRVTREVLRFYEHQNVVTVVTWNELPSRKGLDPNLSLYRLGHSLAHNDCVFRSPSRFVALVDVDEFVVPLSNATLLEFLSEMVSERPLAGSFVFGHSKLRFLGPNGDSDDFSWIQKTVHEEGNGPSKAIFLPDRTEILLTHQVRSHFSPFSAVHVPSEAALLFHARSNWAQHDAPGNFSRIDLFAKEEVEAVDSAHTDVLRFLRRAGVENPAPNRNVSFFVQVCLKGWKERGCKVPSVACFDALHGAEEWSFARDSGDYAIL